MAGNINNVVAVRSVGAGATSQTDTYTLARAATAMDVVVISTNANAGTVTVRNGANAFTGALNAGGTDAKVVRPASAAQFTAANKVFAVGDILTFINSANNYNYESYVYLIPTPGVTV